MDNDEFYGPTKRRPQRNIGTNKHLDRSVNYDYTNEKRSQAFVEKVSSY